MSQHRNSTNRFLGIFSPPNPTAATSPLELTEHDIFSAPSGSSSPSPTHPNFSPARTSSNHSRSSQNGILAALNDNLKSRSGFGSSGSGSGSGSEARAVFNHKASTSASLSSSSSTSPATSASSRITIPRRPVPQQQALPEIFRHQSAPINVPVMAMRRGRSRERDLDDIASEEDEEVESEGEKDGVILPPHEVVAMRDSPLLACSVLEGAGRTLKGRDLRQVRNAIWRKTGFID